MSSIDLEGYVDLRGLYIEYNKLLTKCKNKYTFNSLLNSLTIKEKPNFGKPKGILLTTRKAYIIEKNYYIFPRIQSELFLKYRIIDKITYRSVNIPIKINKSIITMPLYDYQEKILQELLTKYTAEQSNKTQFCYLQMDTGLGKTRLACSLVNELSYATLVVVPTIAIGYQWIDEFNELCPDLTVKFYHNGLDIDSGNTDVVIVVINTISKKSTDFVKGFGIMILDEAHEYYTLCNSNVLWLTNTKYVLGLSATPLERPDELDKYVTLHLGKPLYAKNIADIKHATFIGKVKCINYYGSYKYTESITTQKGMVSSVLTIGNIIQDPDRINVIVKEIKRLYEKGHGIFVFAEHRNFLDILKGYLTSMSVDYPEENSSILDEDTTSIIRGGINKEDFQNTRNMTKKGSHIVLTTYGYSRRGISLTEMTAMVLSSPRRNGLRQIIGRILRKGSDETIVREIVDIIDINTMLHSQFYDRKKIYLEKGYPIEYVKIEKEDDEKEDECVDINMTYKEINDMLNDIYGD
jgi:superfamily II DNA or RNA helicase